MAGLYIHIPFCQTRCVYCDFYSTTLPELRRAFVAALCRELQERRFYLEGEKVTTLYFGGGTPTQLQAEEYEEIFRTIHYIYGIDGIGEITIEANPDDLTPDYVKAISRLPFNRVSVGIQTFSDPMLRFLRRRHTAASAISAIRRLREAGYGNISIDLIYGLPGETLSDWRHDLDVAVGLKPEHISAYHLTYEPDTPIHAMVRQGTIRPIDEELSLTLFTELMDRLREAGYEHYEISNFALPQRRSRHNSNYWTGIPYLGCGPSAHSYNRRERQWNAPDLRAYLSERTFTVERLSLQDRYNEYVMTSLRTSRGLDLNLLKSLHGEALYHYCLTVAEPFIRSGKLRHGQGRLCLTRDGLFISDAIISELFTL